MLWSKTKVKHPLRMEDAEKVKHLMKELCCKSTSVHLIDDVLYVSVNQKLIIMYNYKDDTLLVDTTFENKNKLYQVMIVFGCDDKIFRDMLVAYRKQKKEDKLCR